MIISKKRNKKVKLSQIKIGAILTYIHIFLAVVVNMMITPLLTKYLGQAEYGLYNTIISTIAMFSILNLGFGSGYIKFYSIYKNEKDQESINKLNGLFLLIFIFIAIIAFAFGAYLVFNLDLIFSDGLTSNEYIIATKLMLIMAFNMATSFPISVFQNIIIANERFIFIRLISIFRTILPPLATVPILLTGYKSIMVALVTTIITLVSDLIIVYFVFKKIKVKFEFKKLKFSQFKQFFYFTFFIAINLIVDRINWNSGKILLGRYRGTETVAIFTIGFTLYEYFQHLSISISSLFVPRIHQIVNRTLNDKIQQRKKLTDTFIKVGRIQYLILSVAALGVIFFGEEFITKYWVGKQYQLSYIVAIILIVSAMLQRIQNISLEIQRALNKHKFRTYLHIFIVALNIVFSIVLIKKYSVLGATIGYALTLIFGDGIIMSIYCHKHCNIDMIQFFKEICNISIGYIIPIVFGIIIKNVYFLNGLVGFVINVCLFVIVYLLSIWFFSLNKFEKDLVFQIVSKLKRS